MSVARMLALVCAGFLLSACQKGEGKSSPFQTIGRQPDVPPAMLNPVLPFRYPPALYAQKVQGNVTLRIYIDKAGQIVTDSTSVAETSGFSALDSAAIKGARELRFEPARTRGAAVPVSILLPVFFRHPDAPPLAGDSMFARTPVDSAKPAKPAGVVADTTKKDSVAVAARDSSKPAVAVAKKPTATARKRTPTRRTTTPRRTTTTKKRTTTR